MILTIIVFILVLSILVLIHELGHFIVAKKSGIKVEEFGFGLPPRLFGKKYGETMYSINLLPIGGFVRLYGEDGEVGGKDKNRSFSNKPKITRFLVIIAGVTMNFLLGILVISYIFTQGILVPVNRIHIEKIAANSPAMTSGLKEGDVISKMFNGTVTKETRNSEDLISFTNQNLGKETTLFIFRCVGGKPKGAGIECKSGFGQEELSVVVIPRKEVPKDEGPIGIAISNLEEKKYSLLEAPIFGTMEALKITGLMVSTLVTVLWRLVTLAEVPKDIAGPIGVAQITNQALKFGPMAIMQLIGFLSLNLAVVNVLPIPALDGGRLLFVMIETVIGKKLRPKFEQTVNQIGMILLLTLILLITINDVRRILSSSSLGTIFENLSP